MTIPTSYFEANKMLGNRSKLNIKSKRATYLKKNGDNIELVYHRTAVATYTKDNKIVLNSGGYRSLTTKVRMNSALGNRAQVFQHKHRWYYSTNDGTNPFEDGVCV